MTQQTTFCTNCGQSINPGSTFCMACGTRVAVQMNGQPYAPQSAASPLPQRRRKPSIFIMLIGLIMILIGLRGPAVLLFGQVTTGKILSVEQVIDSSSDRMDYNYRVTYEFYAAGGKRQTGSYDLNKVYSVANLPDTGTSLSIRYIPVLPLINIPAGQGNPGLAMLLMCGLGVLLIILGAKGSLNTRMGKGGNR